MDGVAGNCDRALTEDVKRDAEKWMKDAPIAMYSEKPDCYYGVAKKGDSLMEGKK